MDEKQLQLLWESHAKNGGFKDYNEFKSLIMNPNSRKVYFDDANAKLGFKDYTEFETILQVKPEESVKKKVGGEDSFNLQSMSRMAGMGQSIIPEVSKNPNYIKKDEDFEKKIIESNKRAVDFDSRLVGKMIGTGGGDKVVAYGQNAPIDKPEQLPEITEFKEQDIIEYPKSNFAPTGYKQLQNGQWVDVARPKKISGENAEVVIRAFKPTQNPEIVKEETKQLVKNDKPLDEFISLSESGTLNEKILTDPAFAKTLSEVVNKNPTQTRTGDGRFNLYEKAVVSHYKLEEDPFIKYPTVDHKEFVDNTKEINKLKPVFDEINTLSEKAKQLKAKYELGKDQATADEFNKTAEKINLLLAKTKPLVEYFGREDVSNVLQLSGLQERGQQELSSALNYFPEYKKKHLEAYNKSLEKESVGSGLLKSFAGGALDMISGIVHTAAKWNPFAQDYYSQINVDKLKDEYDLWSKAKFTTGEAAGDFWSVANQVARMTPQVIGIMATRNPRLANIAFVGAPAWSDSYKESISKGLTQEQAYAKGIVDAGIETLSESIVPDRAMIKGFKPSKELTELGLKEFGSDNFNRLMAGEIKNHLVQSLRGVYLDFRLTDFLLPS